MTEQVRQALRRRTNHHDRVIVREQVLLDELRIGAEELRAALSDLENQRAIKVVSPLPFLVLKWSGKRPMAAKNARETAVSCDPGYSYSFNNQSIDKSIAIKAIDDAGADAELLQDILATLGESDPTTFRGVLAHYPAKSIRAVLERVRSTPPEKFRKSKTALFRYLLAKRKHLHP